MRATFDEFCSGRRCCCCCCPLQVKLLVEEGGADPSLVDRWEQSPLDEARRVGAAPVVEYLAGCVTGEAGWRRLLRARVLLQ